jgi:hypothetical protein
MCPRKVNIAGGAEGASAKSVTESGACAWSGVSGSALITFGYLTHIIYLYFPLGLYR